MSPTRIRLHDAAEREFLKSCDWYENQAPAVAIRFADEVRDALARVREDPERWPLSGRFYRWIKVRHFPFVVRYRILDPSHVFVVAIAHTSRKSDYWRWRRP